jgi:hypothetical protein
MPAVGVSAVTAEGSNFGHNLIVLIARNQNDAEVRAYGKGSLKQGKHLVGRRAGRYVEVLRLATQ